MVQTSGAVRQAIEHADRQLEAAFNRGDMAALAALYTEDAVVLPPNGDAVRGRQGIESFWSGARQMGVRDAKLQTVQVDHEGDLAYEVGTYRLGIQPPAGEPVTDEGKYLVVWKHTPDEGWKLAADIWNTSTPPPVP